ncbi:putative ribosome biogenesis GTPase RsgA [Longispora fulva]|uniref:Small ribosomal subunit biogenesis GTPase RsgA n=1 Tax=Longispora fulva TaxID=619741 RepID=A0A8J7GW76_9ACTN|nr:ribosome biogenesis GTPase [Longispora fulva]GIG58215.1 putative ribosome biogenesis GTPase RsgA [Longispora fulva]
MDRAPEGPELLKQSKDFDEDDVRVRPGKRSRPRTRIRPKHTDATAGLVIAVDRGRYTCVTDDGELTAMRARELGRKSVVVGDRVGLVGDVTGSAGSLARIVRIEERVSTLMRTADDDDPTERVVVANADQLVIVAALADPQPRTGFIDRCLVAAYHTGITPLLCLTKGDLAGPEELLDYYSDLDLAWLVMQPGSSIDPLVDALDGKLSVLVGHSGVGKSTLVNRLVPGTDRAVGVVSAIGKGRHTSTSAVALPLVSGDGWIIDTPGIRSFGLAHVSAHSLLYGFDDLVDGTLDCPPNCEHDEHSPDCALTGWVAAGNADPRRLASYRRLLASRAGEELSGPDRT